MSHLRTLAALILIVSAILMAVPAYAANSDAQSFAYLSWAYSADGAVEEDALGLAVDSEGSTIAVGAKMRNGTGPQEAYVVKLGLDGDPVWAVSISGTKDTVANDVAVDANGDIYVIGSFAGVTDFDPGPTFVGIESNGSSDVFLLRLDPNGKLIRIVTFGSDKSDDGQAVFVDVRGHIYITGSFEETIEIGSGGDDDETLESDGEDDVFIIRYAPDGTLLRAWALGGDDDAVGRDIIVDGVGNVYVAGEFEGKIDLDPDLDDIRRSEGDEDIFLAKYSDAADQVWGATIGGRYEDKNPAIAIDRFGNTYVTGDFEKEAQIESGRGKFALTSHGKEDILLGKLTSNGELEWAAAIGGPEADRGKGIAARGDGGVFVTGGFSATVNFDPKERQAGLVTAQGVDIFVARYTAGGDFSGVDAMGSRQDQVGRAIALDSANGLYVAGSFDDGGEAAVGAEDTERISSGQVAAYLPLVSAGPIAPSFDGSGVFVVKYTYDVK